MHEIKLSVQELQLKMLGAYTQRGSYMQDTMGHVNPIGRDV